MSATATNSETADPQVNTIYTEGKKQADSIIKLHARLATAAGMVPVTGLDIALVTAIQINMVKEIARVYDVAFDQKIVQVGISSIIGATIARLVALGAREAFQTFSQFGELADSLTNAAISGFFTAATGEIYSMHFESGGSLADLEISDFIDYASEQIRSGELHPRLFSNISTGFSHLY